MGIVIFLDDMPLFSFMAGLAVICPALKVDDLVIILRSVLEPDGATIWKTINVLIKQFYLQIKMDNIDGAN